MAEEGEAHRRCMMTGLIISRVYSERLIHANR